jgi:hypothetical protein
MKAKLVLVVATLAGFSLPALAAEEFYVAKNEATKKCEVTEVKPDGKKLMMIDKDMYKTKTEAEAALKTAADCK